MACSMFHLPQNCLNISDVKFMPASDTILLGSPNSANTILAAFTRSSAARLSAIFYNRNLLVNLQYKEVLFLTKEYISANHLSRSAWYFIWDCLLVWLCLLILQACSTLHFSVFDACIHIHLIH